MYILLGHTSQRSSNLLLHLRKTVSARDRGTTYLITVPLQQPCPEGSQSQAVLRLLSFVAPAICLEFILAAAANPASKGKREARWRFTIWDLQCHGETNMIMYKRKTIGRQVRMLGSFCLHFNSTYIICRLYDFFRLNRMYVAGLIRSITD
jgi:hypothetical protein